MGGDSGDDGLGLIVKLGDGRQEGGQCGDRVLVYISENIIQRDSGYRNKNIRQYQEKSLRNRWEEFYWKQAIQR